jgi:hypothetical protein
MKTPFNAFKKLQYEQGSLTYTAGKIKTNLYYGAVDRMRIPVREAQ